MALQIEASVNVLWQNLIALNSTLFKENVDRGQQLIEMKKILQEEIEKAKALRTQIEGQQNELLKKNKKIKLLTLKLEKVKQLTMDFSKDVDSEMTSILVEKDLNLQSKSNSTRQLRLHRKQLNYFPRVNLTFDSSMRELNNTEAATRVVAVKADNTVDSNEIKDENLLIPLLSRSSHRSTRKSAPNVSKRRKVSIKSEHCVCNECGKNFRNTETLKRHKFLHTGLKPFACPICSLDR